MQAQVFSVLELCVSTFSNPNAHTCTHKMRAGTLNPSSVKLTRDKFQKVLYSVALFHRRHEGTGGNNKINDG